MSRVLNFMGYVGAASLKRWLLNKDLRRRGASPAAVGNQHSRQDRRSKGPEDLILKEVGSRRRVLGKGRT